MNSYKDFLSEINKSGALVTTIGKTVLGYNIPMLSKGSGTPKILVVGAVHAREHITTKLLLELIKNYDGSSAIDCVPMVNIDGVLLAINGINSFHLKISQREKLIKANNGNTDFSLWKANFNAVDINVNFDAGWGEGAGNTTVPSSASYIGSSPNSEPETQALINLVAANNYALVVSYHSKGEEVYFGFRRNHKYAEEAQEVANFLHYKLKRTPNSAGGFKDYWTEKTARLGLTIEVGEDRFSHPYPITQLPNLVEKHNGVLQLYTQIGQRLWTKYNL